MASDRTRLKGDDRIASNQRATSGKPGLSRRALLLGSVVVGSGGIVAWSVAGLTQSAKARTITVWKSPTCGCCGEWATYMRDKGYQVSVNSEANLDAIKVKFGVPKALYSCHTAKIDDYLIEGHVPEGAIAKLLAERPSLKGIALPGMPEGSPGMNGTPGIYRVFGFDANGQISRFAEVGV